VFLLQNTKKREKKRNITLQSYDPLFKLLFLSLLQKLVASLSLIISRSEFAVFHSFVVHTIVRI